MEWFKLLSINTFICIDVLKHKNNKKEDETENQLDLQKRAVNSTAAAGRMMLETLGTNESGRVNRVLYSLSLQDVTLHTNKID